MCGMMCISTACGCPKKSKFHLKKIHYVLKYSGTLTQKHYLVLAFHYRICGIKFLFKHEIMTFIHDFV